MPEWPLKAGTTEAERRAGEARFHFDSWKTLRDEGLLDHPLLFYYEGPGFFRFSDVRFTLSRDHANRAALEEAGFSSE